MGPACTPATRGHRLLFVYPAQSRRCGSHHTRKTACIGLGRRPVLVGKRRPRTFLFEAFSAPCVLAFPAPIVAEADMSFSSTLTSLSQYTL